MAGARWIYCSIATPSIFHIFSTSRRWSANDDSVAPSGQVCEDDIQALHFPVMIIIQYVSNDFIAPPFLQNAIKLYSPRVCAQQFTDVRLWLAPLCIISAMRSVNCVAMGLQHKQLFIVDQKRTKIVFLPSFNTICVLRSPERSPGSRPRIQHRVQKRSDS